MKKKLLSALLAAAMVVTAIPSAMAAKKTRRHPAANRSTYTPGVHLIRRRSCKNNKNRKRHNFFSRWRRRGQQGLRKG